MIFIFENQISSSMGWLRKDFMLDRYKFDFLYYNSENLDWFAFVTILCSVNIVLIMLDGIVIFTGGNKHNGMS